MSGSSTRSKRSKPSSFPVGGTNVGCPPKELTVEVGELYGVVIDEDEAAYACCDQVLDQDRSCSADAEHQDALITDLLLRKLWSL